MIGEDPPWYVTLYTLNSKSTVMDICSIQHCIDWERTYKSEFLLIKDTPYITIVGEPWGVIFEDLIKVD